MTIWGGETKKTKKTERNSVLGKAFPERAGSLVLSGDHIATCQDEGAAQHFALIMMYVFSRNISYNL